MTVQDRTRLTDRLSTFFPSLFESLNRAPVMAVSLRSESSAEALS